VQLLRVSVAPLTYWAQSGNRNYLRTSPMQQNCVATKNMSKWNSFTTISNQTYLNKSTIGGFYIVTVALNQLQWTNRHMLSDIFREYTSQGLFSQIQNELQILVSTDAALWNFSESHQEVDLGEAAR